MRTKISILLAVVGIIIIVAALTMTGQQKVATIVLGLIIACAGCWVFLVNERFMNQHRGFVIVVSVLLGLLVVGYAIKIG